MKARTRLARARSRVGLVLTAVWLSSVLAIAWPAGLQIENLKITPVLIQKQSSPNLPPEVQQLEQQSAPAAFDRDTVSEHTAYADGFLVAVLDGPTEVRSIKVYGAAPYTLSVQAEINGAWQAVSGLQNLNLANRPEGWNSFDATSAVTTAKLRFALTAAAGSASTSLKGIEIWGKGARVNVRNGSALLAALLGTSAPPHARIYRSTLAQGVIGAAAGGTDDPADNSFGFTLDRNPANFKRVYLTYQVLGLSHWVHAMRSINGGAPLGGFVRPVSTAWSTQIEEINPQWLAQGANTIAFSAPAGATGTFTVKDVFLIAELESGANFVSGASDNQEDSTNPAAAVLDGDAATGWTPYPGGNAVQADIPTLTLGFDKRTQLEGLALNVVGNLKGTIAIEFLKDGAWSPSGAPALVGGKLITGWNTITAPSAGGVDGVRLVFSGGKGSNAEVKELVLSGSGTGPVFNPPQIGVTFPDAGQFFGRLAHIRGFLQPLDNGSGAATLIVGAAPVATSDGAFAVSISKEDVGLAAQGDGETWMVEVKAVYPNGQTVTRVVTLNNWQPALESSEGNLLPTYSQSVPPGQAKKMTHDAGTLDIPANALQFETTIGITPLGETDLPALDAGMTNVTKGPRKGYRYTPTPIKFAAKVKVTLPYSQAAIPPGLTEQDVRTFYFDKQTGSWKVLERESIDPQGNTITSLTDHFTDMINATVTVPDHALTANFNPTQIRDIKAADPGAEVNLIEPPKANSTGDARLTYRIELPPGRQGMEPQLAVQYNSSAGNGWMGMGWDLPMQAIVADTRFGVPRYDANLETETYVLSGEMLTPVAHRVALKARADGTTVINGETVKVFHARVEGQFKRILRKGTTPSTYTWEVTDKNGVRYLYGATDPANETLTDGRGNVFLWALCQVIDPNGNFVRYRYTKVIDPGVTNGTLAGSNIYLSSVTYTGRGLTEGPYSVTLVRDRDPSLNEPLRTDKQIDARGGFKRVTADLLRRIDVSLSGQLIRRYEFKYNENPFGDGRPPLALNKTLLTSISQLTGDGATLFNKHTFTYFDEVRNQAGTYVGFTSGASWNTGGDGLTKSFLGLVDANLSALNGQTGTSRNVDVYLGVGPITPGNKGTSAGAKFGVSSSDNDGAVAFVDMNGDGLPDKVFDCQRANSAPAACSQSRFVFRPNKSGPGPNATTVFGEAVPLVGLQAISKDRSSSSFFGGEGFVAGVSAMASTTRSTATQSAYFTDVNGDGLTDAVINNQVFFNRLVSGVPTFVADSTLTPVPIDQGQPVDADGTLPSFDAERAQLVNENPLMDAVRRWVAPFDGQVEITGDVQLIDSTATDPARAAYTTADGVRVAIQKNATEAWFADLPATDFTPHTPTPGILPVSRGDRIYFRVQSKFDGAFDDVQWNPQIAYVGQAADAIDVNRRPVFRYRASEDFIFGGRASAIRMPFTGTIRFQGDLTKTAATTDDVTLAVYLLSQAELNSFTDLNLIPNQKTPAFSRTLTFDQTGTISFTPGTDDLSVQEGQFLVLLVQVDSPIDATAIQWQPRLVYVQAFAPTTPATDANGNPVSTGFTPGSALPVQDAQGNFTIKIDPLYDVDLYPLDNLTTPQEAFTAPQSGTLTVVPQIATVAGDTTTNSVLVVTVKRKGLATSDRLGKQVVTISNGVVSAPTFTVSVNQGDQLYFDISTRDNAVAARLATASVAVSFTDTSNLTTVPSALHRADIATTFPESYRGWSYVAYNGNGSCDQKRALGDTGPCIEPPIDETKLVLTTATDPNARSVYPAVAKPRDMLWASEDDRWQIKAERMSSSRHGLDDLTVPTTASFATAAAVPRVSRNSQNALGGGFFITLSTANSNNRALLDFMDLNGDRYPDVVSSEGFVQYTRPTGRLDDLKTSVNSGGVRTAMSKGNTIGGPGSLPTLPGSAKSDNNKDNKDQVTKPESQSPSFSISGSLGEVSNQSTDMLVDINGDGLPDRVTEDLDADGKPNGVLKVRLNLGYTFAPQPETWGFANLSTGRSVNASVSAGFSDIWRGFSAGANVSIQNGQSLRMLTDLNGDGLPDAVFNRDGKLMVALNTGAGFADAVEWSTESALGDSKGFNLGAGGSFEIDIPIPILGIVLVINPAASVGESVERGENTFQDIDGDGYADHLTSSQDSTVDVRINRVGRTNLLKKVHRPLGATFDLEYTRDGNTFDLPQSRWVVTKFTVFDGHAGEGADRQMTTFAYSAPKYNRLEREFYGYGTVIERHLDTQKANALFRSIQRDYRTDSYYAKGLLARELTSDAAARPFLETQNTYVLRNVDLNIEPADPASTTATEFPQLTRIERRFFEGGESAQKTTATQNEYDAVGNISRFTDAGELGAVDDAIAAINYTFSDPACQSSYIVGKASKIVVTGNGATMRNREATIDCTTGNVLQVRQFLETGPAAVTDLAYFQNGNIQSVIGPANLNGQRYRLDYLYEPTVDTHLARATDSFGLSSTFEYDLRFGKRTTTTDINGQKVTYAYDAFGRADTIVGPYEQSLGQITIAFEYAPVQTPTSDAAGYTMPLVQVPFAITKHIDKDANGLPKTSSGTIDTIVFTDGLKRVLQMKKDAAVNTGADSTAVDVMTVSGQVTFDAFGRTVEVRYPTTEPKATNTTFNPAFDAVAPTTMTFDVLDRNISTTIPDGTSTTIAYAFGTDRQGLMQFQTTVTDANRNVKQTYKDVRELVTTVKEFNQGATILTSYGYDPLKQIVQVEDDRHNLTRIAYDNLGRRTVIDNPDSGKTEIRYDLASNITAKVTANLRSANRQINYNYEFNRLTAIGYPNFPGNNVTYTYGAPSAAGDANGNRAGRIATISSQMGSEERFYGRQGEITKEVKTVVTFTTPNAPEVYTTLYQFDTWNRLMRLTYPDGEILTYAYDSGGLLNFAQGQKRNFTYSYINRLEYDKFEQRAFVEAGNNVRTRYAYDEKTRRLCNLTSAKGTGGTPGCVTSLDGALPVQNNIQNLLYVYDNVGNIVGEANSVPVPQPNQFGGPTRQTFVYDDLYRLTQASGTFSFNPSKTQTYSMIMAYDSIHNIVSKSQSDVITQPSGTPITQKKTSYLFNYGYGSPRPHAPTHIGNRTFSYDANGNQLGWDNDDNGTRRTIVWDEENRIQSLFDNGHEKTYKYDDQGQRIIKRGPQGETVYVNQYFTIRNKQIGTKHVFAGTTRMVSKLMKQDKPGANPQGNTPVEKDLFFFHPDHIGSSHYITDTQGQLFEHLEYFPFGETWVEESTNTQRTPYLFTGKEFDEETNLYYFGARYYDPRTTVWQSADPALTKFLPTGDRTRDQTLPGMGGVYNPLNLGLYTYAHQNPVKLADPDGQITRAEVVAAFDARRAQGGVVPRTADDAFESAALRSFGLAKNNSPLRSGRVPDGVVGQQGEQQMPFFRNVLYPKSVLVEAKNLGSNVGPTAQISDYLTDLQGTTRGAINAVPILMLITPEGVALSPSLISEANAKGVSILHFQMVTTQDGANPQIAPVLVNVVGRISPPIWAKITQYGGRPGVAQGGTVPMFVPRPVPLFLDPTP